MRVNVLSYEPAGGWILYDYAVRLAQHLRPHVERADVTFAQTAGYDVTFHINYAPLRELRCGGLHSTMVTHVDSAAKFALIKAQAQAGVWGFCMSEETARRMRSLTGIERFVSMPPPAMIEAAPYRLNIMMAGRLYEDGRKNEDWAIDFLKSLQPADIVIRIMGAGWDDHVKSLCAQGYEIHYQSDFDRRVYVQWLESSDHLLYTGNDEGALSTLDALIHGVVPIVTAQGYHLEQEGSMLTFSNRDQLLRISERIQTSINEENGRRKRLTDWDSFARKHFEMWSMISKSVMSSTPAVPEFR